MILTISYITFLGHHRFFGLQVNKYVLLPQYPLCYCVSYPKKKKVGRPKKGEDRLSTVYEEACQLAKDEQTDNAKKYLGAYLNVVDGSNHGVMEDGNTARKLVNPINLDKWMMCWYFISIREEQIVREMHIEGWVIYSVENHTGKIENFVEFGIYVLNAYVSWVENFPPSHFPNLAKSLHWSLGHIAEIIFINDGFGTGESSESK